MNSKMTTNSQLSTAESKKEKTKQTKQTTIIGTESQVWGSFGGLSAGKGKGKKGEMVQGLRSVIGRNKIDSGMLGTVQKMQKPKNLHAQPTDMN